MSQLAIQKQGLVTTISNEDLEMLLILAALEIRNNPPTDCSFNWEEAINKALIQIRE